MNDTFIYGLIDPRTAEIRYVGRSRNPQLRLSGHLHSSRNPAYGSAVCSWIRELFQEGLEPQMVLIENAGSEWQEAETRWITVLRDQGYDLTNKREGGMNSGTTKPPRPKLMWWAPERGIYDPEANA